MDALLADEVRDLSERSLRRRSRQVDRGTIAAIVFVSVVAGAVSYGLAYLAQSTTGAVSFLSWLVFFTWTGFAVLLVLAGGMPRIYKNKTGVSA